VVGQDSRQSLICRKALPPPTFTQIPIVEQTRHVASGCSDLRDPTARAKSIEMSQAFTTLLGIAELGPEAWAKSSEYCPGLPPSVSPSSCSAPSIKGFLLAHPLLGRESLPPALRPDLHPDEPDPDEPGHRFHRRRRFRPDAIAVYYRPLACVRSEFCSMLTPLGVQIPPQGHAPPDCQTAVAVRAAGKPCAHRAGGYCPAAACLLPPQGGSPLPRFAAF
jgi:hypothetical protein